VGWDSMIESVKTVIIQNECPKYGTSIDIFFTTIQDISITKWDKNCTPLHYLMAHSLNPRHCNNDRLNGGPSCRFPNQIDGKILQWRKETFKRIYRDVASFYEVVQGFVEFSFGTRRFQSYDMLVDRGLRIHMLGGKIMGQCVLFYRNYP
jgi:hypothetical protein